MTTGHPGWPNADWEFLCQQTCIDWFSSDNTNIPHCGAGENAEYLHTVKSATPQHKENTYEKWTFL